MPIPHDDLGLLITLDIGLAILGLLLTFAGVWAILWQAQRTTRETREGMREIAQITREVAFMIRRQYADIDRDLQEIKDLLGFDCSTGAPTRRPCSPSQEGVCSLPKAMIRV